MTDAIEATGAIILTPLTPFPGAAVQMTFDPDTITEVWPARKSLFAGISGSVTTQDFGRYVKDCRKTLVWGWPQSLDLDVAIQLANWYATPASTYRYEDDEDNDWTVEIMQLQIGRVFGQPRLYRCTLELHALAMTTYLGNSVSVDDTGKILT